MSGPTSDAPAAPPLDGVSFDHVAIAVERITDPWPLLADVLGGRYLDRGINPGFGWTQLRFANGFVVEGLHPEQVGAKDGQVGGHAGLEGARAVIETHLVRSARGVAA